MSTLIEIKRLLMDGRYRFTDKATTELQRDHLTRYMAIEAILSAPAIVKRLASHNPHTGEREYLYVIVGQTHTGMVIYTKGKISKKSGVELFYFIISSKRDING